MPPSWNSMGLGDNTNVPLPWILRKPTFLQLLDGPPHGATTGLVGIHQFGFREDGCRVAGVVSRCWQADRYRSGCICSWGWLCAAFAFKAGTLVARLGFVYWPRGYLWPAGRPGLQKIDNM